MIEVWIRDADEDTGRRLCSWPATELDSLMPAIGRWGVQYGGEVYFTNSLSGQINVDDIGAYFDICIVGESS